MADRKPVRRCAIYTRKSSEEGLDQNFNSLDAQREACAAYIASQRQEGWREVPTAYDDGGYSGGTLDRPALQRLLADMRAGQIDLLIVYKIDRLTRSLTDFASLVTVFESHAASFVSVTQHFNTTTSMGRLTLNVLLSFAQFEREVTGERIRDKIAASKRKGMWMGGTVPLGYDSVDRKLVIVPEEAKKVRRIFEKYCEVGSVAKLQDALKAAGDLSKVRVNRAGRHYGGRPFSRGALYLLLQNRVYQGQIPHRKESYPGEHEAIVSQELWESVQARLAANRESRHLGKRTRDPSLLAGLLVDESGRRLTPSHTLKNGKRYRYYIARPTKTNPSAGLTVPAHDLERTVMTDICGLLRSNDLDQQLAEDGSGEEGTGRTIRTAGRQLSEQLESLVAFERRAWLRTALHRIEVGRESIAIHVKRSDLAEALLQGRPKSVTTNRSADDQNHDSLLARRIPALLQRCASEIRIIGINTSRSQTVPPHHQTLIHAIARARRWHEMIASGSATSMAGIARSEGFADRYVSRLLCCAHLAPDLVEALIDGTAPPELTLAKILKGIPSSWADQRRTLGFICQITATT